MRLFCSYAYTGEDVETVIKRMRMVVDTLEDNGHEVYCPLFDELVAPLQEAHDVKAIFDHAFEGISRQEALVVVVSSERRSEGQLIEVGAALSQNKPVYLMQHETAVDKSYLPKLVDETYVWKTTEDLRQQLAKIK